MDDANVDGSSSAMVINGSAYSTSTQRPGKIGSAYIFQSHPQAPKMYGTLSVAKTTNIKLSANGVYSVSCWFNTGIYPEFYPNGIENYIISKQEGTKEMDLLLKKGGFLAFRSWFNDDAYDEVVSTDSVPVNRWVHAAVTVDWSNKIEKLYVNGIEKASKTLTAQPQYNYGRTPLYFANKGIWSPAAYEVVPQFNGAIDEVKIYDDQILTPEFIMSESSVNVEPDHCWTFNEDWYVNNRIKDFQGFNDLTLTGDVQFVPGKIGSTAMSLSKDNQFATTQDVLSVSDNGNYCVGGWVFPTAYNGSFLNSIIAEGNTANVFSMNMNASGTMTAKVWSADGSSNVSIESSLLPLKVWSNVMLQVNNTAHKCVLYVNGTAVKESAMAFTPNMTAGKMVIGAVGGASFRGMIDDVSLYRNRVLTQEDMTWLANKKELKAPLYAPVYIEDYGQTSHRQVGYEPKFIAASEFSFDSKNRPYNRDLDFAQYLDENGEWHRVYFKDFIKAAIPSWDGTYGLNYQFDNRIVFDNDDWAYTTIRLGNSKALILYSLDYCRTWKVLQLGCDAWLPSWEVRSVHNSLKDPPILMSQVSYTYTPILNASPNANELCLFFFTKSGNELQLDQKVQLGVNGNTTVHHSGGGCQVISTADKVFIVYAKQVGDNSSTPIYAMTVNKDYFHTQSNETYLTSIGTSYDAHNYGSMEMDKDGYLHVVVTGHHHKMQYLKSKYPYSTDEWSTATSLDDGNATYGALIMDNNDKLHLITRFDLIGGYTFTTSEATKEATGTWQKSQIIVSPRRDNYHAPQHHLVIDRKGNLYMSCAYIRTQSGLNSEMKSYQKEWPELNIYIDNLGDNQYGSIVNAPFFQAETYILPAGETRWRLATTEDFMNNFISTGVNDVTNDNRNDIKLLRTGDNDQLSIADVNEKTTWNVYSIDGMLIMNGHGSRLFTTGLKKGLYILRVNNSSVKFFK
jgi:hypothetical protein